MRHAKRMPNLSLPAFCALLSAVTNLQMQPHANTHTGPATDVTIPAWAQGCSIMYGIRDTRILQVQNKMKAPEDRGLSIKIQDVKP